MTLKGCSWHNCFFNNLQGEKSDGGELEGNIQGERYLEDINQSQYVDLMWILNQKNLKIEKKNFSIYDNWKFEY